MIVALGYGHLTLFLTVMLKIVSVWIIIWLQMYYDCSCLAYSSIFFSFPCFLLKNEFLIFNLFLSLFRINTLAIKSFLQEKFNIFKMFYKILIYLHSSLSLIERKQSFLQNKMSCLTIAVSKQIIIWCCYLAFFFFLIFP